MMSRRSRAGRPVASVLVAGLALLFAAGGLSCASAPVAASVPPVPPTSFTVVATGDVLLHQKGSLVRGAARTGEANGTAYDFTGVFAAVAPVIRGADLAICHLETPVAPPEGPFRGYPSFAVQPQIVHALADAGYDSCSTASNHSFDDGFDGLVRTLDTLDAAGVAHTGTSRSAAQRDVPRIVEVHGVRVAQLSWTYGLNGIALPPAQEWSVNVFDAARADVTGMLEEAARARQAGAEVVIASVHCCTEYDHDPSDAQLTVAQALLASPDIDLVLGHHAHVVQPFERIAGKWVAYGLGNHVAQQNTPGGTRDSVIARFTFTRDADGRFTITRAEAVPTRIDVADDGVRVVPTAARVDPADAASYDRVVEALQLRGAVQDGLVVTGG